MGFRTASREPVAYNRWFTDNPARRVDDETGRYYVTPDGSFPSVTRAIGETAEKGWLDDWIARVGESEAERIRDEASHVGNTFHDLNESWITGCDGPTDLHPEGRALHRKCIPVMREHYREFVASEEILWSKKLGLAGTMDYAAWTRNDQFVVGDFKNSRKMKTRDQIGDYWIQATLYAIMWWSLTGRRPDRIDIIMAVREDLTVQMYSEPFTDWLIQRAVQRVLLFRNATVGSLDPG